jgi:hypothetical protein
VQAAKRVRDATQQLYQQYLQKRLVNLKLLVPWIRGFNFNLCHITTFTRH